MIDPHGEPVRENYRRQGEVRERERIVALLETAMVNHAKVIVQRPSRSDTDVRHTICRTYQEAIALIKKDGKE
jgi:hypothetical protein